MAEPRYSITWPMPPPVPMRPMVARITSLAVTSAGRSPSTDDGHPPGADLGQGLGGQHVLDLRGADAEGQRSERAVRRRVGVAAHDGHPRQGASLLRADHMDDALTRIAHRVQRDVELGRVGPQHLDLAGRDRVGDGLVDVGRGHVVVLGRHRQVGPADAALADPEPVEGLWAGDLVHQVEIDVEQVGLARRLVHDVAIPHLLRQGEPGHRRRPSTWSHAVRSHSMRWYARCMGAMVADGAGVVDKVAAMLDDAGGGPGLAVGARDRHRDAASHGPSPRRGARPPRAGRPG